VRELSRCDGVFRRAANGDQVLADGGRCVLRSLALIVAIISFAPVPAAAQNLAQESGNPDVVADDPRAATAETVRIQQLQLERERAAQTPESADQRLAIAEARVRLGELNSAAELLRQGVEAGEDVQVQAAFGRLLILLERFERASEVLVDVVEQQGSEDLRHRYWLAESFAGRGRHSRATAEYMDVVRRAADRELVASEHVVVARSLWALGRIQDANASFRETLEAFPSSRAARVAWAELFADRYRPDEAIGLYREVLSADPNNARVLVLMASAVFESRYDRAAASALLDRAAEIAPGLPESAELRSAMLIDDRQFAAAVAALDDVLERFPDRRAALSLRASAANLVGDDDTVRQIEAAVLGRDPLYAELYVTIGQGAVRHFRYREAVEWFRKAVDLDADDAAALVALGIAYSRVGEDGRAIRLLQRAFDNDPFNVEAYNMATLWEQSLIHYRFLDDTKIEGLRYRFHEDVFERFSLYIPPLMRDAWRTYEERYAFTPSAPVSIEVFEDRESFSVRSVGLPHAGQHGICFGHLVTSRSPSDRNFNWHQVLAHELSHVFSLQASNYRVPRWFTEGLAEYDTMLSRPEWWREHDMALAQALRADRLIPIAELDRAFVDVQRPQQVVEAYYQASLVVAFIGDTYGYQAIRATLARFAAGDETPEALEAAVGVPLAELDELFARSLRQRLAPLLVLVEPSPHLAPELAEAQRLVETSPNAAEAVATLAVAQVAAGELEPALASLERALELDPNQPIALYLRGHFRAADHDDAGALADLERLVDGPHDSASGQLTIALVRQRQGDERGALEAATQATLLSPRDVEGWTLRVALERACEGESSLPSLVQLVLLDQHAAAAARELGARYLAMGRYEDAFAAARQSNDTDPFDSHGHFLYGSAAFELSNWPIARRELQFALDTASGERDAILAMLITTYEALGDGDEAERMRRLLGTGRR
jgi:tetratricopeptide (TPR) repeat protein